MGHLPVTQETHNENFTSGSQYSKKHNSNANHDSISKIQCHFTLFQCSPVCNCKILNLIQVKFIQISYYSKLPLTQLIILLLQIYQDIEG